MLKRKKRKFKRHCRKNISSRKAHTLLRLEQKLKNISRQKKAKIKKAFNKINRNINLRMRMRELWDWGCATFSRSLSRMKSRGRIPRRNAPK